MRRVILSVIIGIGLFSGTLLAEDTAQMTITGVVEKIEYISPNPWACCKYMRIAVRTAPGKIVYAWIPPTWSIGLQIGIGDRIELQGISFQYASPGILVSFIRNLTSRRVYTLRWTYGPHRCAGFWRGPRYW